MIAAVLDTNVLVQAVFGSPRSASFRVVEALNEGRRRGNNPSRPHFPVGLQFPHMPQLVTADAASGLLELVERLDAQQGFAEVVASLRGGHGATLDGVWGSSCALVAATLARHSPGPLVVVCPHPADIDTFVDDLALFTAASPATFPAWETSPGEGLIRDEVYGERLRLLKVLAGSPRIAGPDSPPSSPSSHGPPDADATSRLARKRPKAASLDPSTAGTRPAATPANNGDSAAPAPAIVVTSIQSLLQPVPSLQALREGTRRLRRGEAIDLTELTRWLLERGFHSTGAVELPGEFSLRGGILDLFAPDWYDPVRIELFGDEIDSLRRFEVASQRSLATLDEVEVTVLDAASPGKEHFAGYLPPSSWLLLAEPPEIDEEGRRYLQRSDEPDQYHSVSSTLQQLLRFPSATAERIARGSLETTCHLRIESVERFSGDVHKVKGELDAAGHGQQVFVVCQTEAEATRLGELFADTQLAAEGRLHYTIGRLHAGFRLVSERIALVGGAELFHRHELARPASRRRLGRVIDSFLELREGDYVVHVGHGIGRYRGLRLLGEESLVEEHLELEFQGGTKIFVPASKINLVQKYVGGSKSRPTLARIGGRTWDRHKAAAQAAVDDLAADMLDLQARRGSQPGISFPVETAWQKEFGAAFPYRETGDQLAAIAAIDRDMHEARPMDRLICGDVGFGKTEVAMRAAFKAVDSGYQVAVLVPTTVLAEQHRRTFTERMAEYPFVIESLSRFSTRGEQKKVLARLEAGEVDVVIGTHRMVQPDVKFHNLGLVIIDEEQRFGVDVKERLKSLRAVVDVLTLTATPIPRTLHMSLLGLRDISNLETPPEDRLAVETRVTRFDDELIRHAVLRELNRGGQIFFVHNRIQDIHAIARRLERIVPEATVRIGHGQMGENELEEVMLGFVNHEFDLLLATTIVESGLDIPNANTMFIDEADHYGLADLHQLRGRVGRYKHRAYCYLLLDPAKSLTPSAARRLRAIEEFSDVGAGFAVAMRDLEIRGAGNILGSEQSGHIATVGYEYYCELLEQTVRRLKRLPPKLSLDVHVNLPGDAFLPRSYVPDLRLKIDLYRRLSRVITEKELDELAQELADRFGPRPPPVERMLDMTRLRILAHLAQIRSIHLEPGYVVLGYSSRAGIEQLARRHQGRLRIVDGESAYLPLGRGVRDADAIRGELKALLRPV